jgi:hypothetical protein
MPDYEDFEGVIYVAAADVDGAGIHAGVNVSVTSSSNPERRHEGWVRINDAMMKEGLAVALSALAGNGRISLYMADVDPDPEHASWEANAVRSFR